MKFKRTKNPYKYEIPYGYVIDYRENNIKIEIEKQISQLLKGVNYKLIQNKSLGTVYYFETNKMIELLNHKYLKGEYILKVEKLTLDEVENLKKLSELKLIPKIFSIDEIFIYNNFKQDEFLFIIIMEFINGIDLQKLISKYYWNYYDTSKDIILRRYLANEIRKEYNKYGKNIHGDLNPRNILVTKDGKVYFIDPQLYYDKSDRIKAKPEQDWSDLASIIRNLYPDIEKDLYKTKK